MEEAGATVKLERLSVSNTHTCKQKTSLVLVFCDLERYIEKFYDEMPFLYDDVELRLAGLMLHSISDPFIEDETTTCSLD